MAEVMATSWVQFAKMGNPAIPGLVDWPLYDVETARYLYMPAKKGFEAKGSKPTVS